jgi:hypothetical protein
MPLVSRQLCLNPEEMVDGPFCVAEILPASITTKLQRPHPRPFLEMAMDRESMKYEPDYQLC